MTFEVEQKFPISDPASLAAEIAALGGTCGDAISQADTYYAHPSRDFGATDEALRIRCQDGGNFITYKGPKLDAATKTRREIELQLAGEVDNAVQLAEMLELLGFQAVATVRKTRRPAALLWRDWNVHVAMDEVDDLGSYAELETTADESQLDSARTAIQALAAELGLSGAERRSYLELLLERLRP
jgi:adenylate cyclase class 2